jgi:hypothetical protein
MFVSLIEEVGMSKSHWLNTKQRCVLFVGLLLLVLSGLVVPFKRSSISTIKLFDGDDATTTYQSDVIYRPIFMPQTNSIDVSRLLLEWIFLLLITAGFMLLFKERAEPKVP